MAKCNPAATPGDGVFTTVGKPLDTGPLRQDQELVGSFIYLVSSTRLDIAYCHSALTSPEQTRSSSPVLGKTTPSLLERGSKSAPTMQDRVCHSKCFSDHSYSVDPSTSRSTSGYVFCKFRASISWLAKRQYIVVLTTTEAENIVPSFPTQEPFYLGNFLHEL
ncbi:unnamed protein product, partial [Discosporangium mesarthrocarpum]